MTMETGTEAVSPTADTMALLNLAAGGWIAQAVYVAAKLGIADILEHGPKRPAEIAAITGSDPHALHRLMRTLASVGVFAEDNEERFGLTPLADGLRSSAKVSLRAFAVMLGEDILWRPWGRLLDAVQSGKAAFETVFGERLYDYLTQHPEAAAIFNAAISDRARQENEAVVKAYDWWPPTIVDIGGGQGSLLAAILASAPASRGILFETPHVTKGGSKLIAAAGLTDRCSVAGGNFFEAVPTGGDLYLMRRVLHGWSDERAKLILLNTRAVMGERSRLVIIEHVLAAGNEPSWGKMLDLQQLVLSDGGRERTLAEYETLFHAAQLSVSRVIKTSSTASLIEVLPVAL